MWNKRTTQLSTSTSHINLSHLRIVADDLIYIFDFWVCDGFNFGLNITSKILDGVVHISHITGELLLLLLERFNNNQLVDGAAVSDTIVVVVEAGGRAVAARHCACNQRRPRRQQ